MSGLVAVTLAVLTATCCAAVALAADPSPVLIDPFDPRAEGEGPGIVGSPLIVAAAVILLGLAAAAMTAAYVRLTRR
jgi:hypothetical protein